MSRQRKVVAISGLSALALVLAVQLALAAQGGAGGARGGAGGRGGVRGGQDAQGMQRDPMAARGARTDIYRTMLRADDAQWAKIEPKLQKVQDLSRELEGRGAFGARGGFGATGQFGGRGQGGPGGQDAAGGQGRGQGVQGATAAQPEGPVAKATAELREVLRAEAPDATAVASKLDALRKAKATVKTQLVVAQKELKGVVTPVQEAQLVMMGMLD
ncbi:MAG TPA: hypothetical protein ENN81_05710 [Phycisphaerales bacterium]|nr:hypothetical protein [Phycisphaerales bacterium]